MKLTNALERVLRVFLEDPQADRYGYDLMKAAKVASGTLYPMLARLQDEGLVTYAWEEARPDAGGRPPRKYYRLTGVGVRVARLELAQASLDNPAAPGSRRTTGRPATGSAQ